MRQPGRASWVSKAVRWVATRLQGALGWLQAAPRHRPADTLPSDGDPSPPAPGAAAYAPGVCHDGAPSREALPGMAEGEDLGQAGPVEPGRADTGPASGDATSAEDLGLTAGMPAERDKPPIHVTSAEWAPASEPVGHVTPAQSAPIATPRDREAPTEGPWLAAPCELPPAASAHPATEPVSHESEPPAPMQDAVVPDPTPPPEWPAAPADWIPVQDLAPLDGFASPDSTATALGPAAGASAEIAPATKEQAERLIALLEGRPIGSRSAAAEELVQLFADEGFAAIVNLIAASDRSFDDLRLPAAKHLYERIMARPLRPREPVRFREPVHDLGVLQMLYQALRDFSQTEGVPLIIPPAGITMVAPTGQVVSHEAWWTCDALGQELKAPNPDIRAANGRVLGRLFPHLAANILRPERIATLTSAPKPGRKIANCNHGRADHAPSDDPPVDAVVISEGTPAAGIWLRGHGTAAWTIRMAMSRGTEILDSGELDRVRRDVEVAAWHGNLRHRVLTAIAAYLDDPHGYDVKAVKKRLGRKAADRNTDTPFAFGDECLLFDAWRLARLAAEFPFDRSIGMPTVDLLAAEWIAQIAPPFCAALDMAPPADPCTAPERQSYAHHDAA